MNKIAKISMLALGAAMVTQALQAQNAVSGDLILGFDNGTSDYVLDLGALPTTTTDFSSEWDGTATGFGGMTGSGQLTVGAIEGNNIGGTGSTVAISEVRTGSADTAWPSGKGTETLPTSPSTRPNISNAASLVTAITTGLQATSAAGSFENVVAFSATANTFTSYLGAADSPFQNLNGSTIVLDIFKDTQKSSGVNPYVFAGDLSINTSTGSIVFDPVAVPEPATYGLLAGGGLLALAIRRQFVRKNA
jgi:PEP-CTERM motif